MTPSIEVEVDPQKNKQQNELMDWESHEQKQWISPQSLHEALIPKGKIQETLGRKFDNGQNAGFLTSIEYVVGQLHVTHRQSSAN